MSDEEELLEYMAERGISAHLVLRLVKNNIDILEQVKWMNQDIGSLNLGEDNGLS